MRRKCDSCDGAKTFFTRKLISLLSRTRGPMPSRCSRHRLTFPCSRRQDRPRSGGLLQNFYLIRLLLHCSSQSLGVVFWSSHLIKPQPSCRWVGACSWSVSALDHAIVLAFLPPEPKMSPHSKDLVNRLDPSRLDHSCRFDCMMSGLPSKAVGGCTKLPLFPS